VLFDQINLSFPLIGADAKGLFHLLCCNVKSFGVDTIGSRNLSDRGLFNLTFAVATVEYVSQHAAVFAVTGPQEFALVFPEPVNKENLRQILGNRSIFSDVHPVLEIVAHMVSAEGKHSKGIATYTGFQTNGSSGNLRAYNRTHENTVVPAVSLMNQGHRRGTTTAEKDSRDRYTGRIFPIFVDGGALRCGSRETGIGMCNGFVRSGIIYLVFPGNSTCGALGSDTFPPDVAIRGKTHVGEDGVGASRQHSIRVGVHRGERSYAKETGFGIDGIKTAIGTKLHPGNIITYSLHFPSGNGGDKHGQIGLSAGTRESGSHVFLFALGIGKPENKHMFSKPTLFFCHR